MFGDDVAIVPNEQPLPLARAIVRLPAREATHAAATREAIEREFRPAGVAAQYATSIDDVHRGASDMIAALGRALAAAVLAALARRRVARRLSTRDRRRCTSNSTSTPPAASSTASIPPETRTRKRD